MIKIVQKIFLPALSVNVVFSSKQRHMPCQIKKGGSSEKNP